jgi:hypothetical protein
MGNVRIKQGLILATLAALVSGCSTWEGPRAKVEDRRAPGLDRSKTATAKAAGGVRDSGKALPQKTASPKATEKPQREERQTAKEVPGAQAIPDAVSGQDQILEMKPERFSSRSSR